MDEQEKQKIEEIENRLSRIENVQNIDFVQKLLDFIIKDITGVTDADVTTTITVGMSNADVLDFPDRWVLLRLNGKIYRVGTWLQELDSSR